MQQLLTRVSGRLFIVAAGALFQAGIELSSITDSLSHTHASARSSLEFSTGKAAQITKPRIAVCAGYTTAPTHPDYSRP